MGRKRRRFSQEFKAKVALASLKGDLTTAELASKFTVHAGQAFSWKQRRVDGAAGLFADGRSQQDESLASEQELYA